MANSRLNDEASRDEFVVFTRRRLDVWFVVSFIAFVAVSVFLAFHETFRESSARFWLWPVAVLLPWLVLRFQIPKQGYHARRISRIPGLSQLGAWLASIFNGPLKGVKLTFG